MNKKANEKKAAQAISNTKTKRLLNLKEAAEYLGISVWTVRERIWAGDIPFVRFPKGRKMYIDIVDIENFIQKNKTTFI